MDSKDLASGNIGTIGKYDIAFTDGKLVVSQNASADGVIENFSLSVSGKSIVDAIAAKIGGPIPQEVAQFLEMSLGLK